MSSLFELKLLIDRIRIFATLFTHDEILFVLNIHYRQYDGDKVSSLFELLIDMIRILATSFTHDEIVFVLQPLSGTRSTRTSQFLFFTIPMVTGSTM